MILKQITPDEAKNILSDSELFSRVCDGSVEYDSLKMPEDHVYVGAFDGDQIIGFYWIHLENSTTVILHANILKEHRGNSFKASSLIIPFIYEKMKGIHKINVKIPVCYPDVYKHTKKFGFVDEGIDRKSTLRNGELQDQYILGLTREDFENGRG